MCCVKCLRDHIKHEFEPLKKKASEVRAKLFEALTQWELNEKPARAKKELVSATLASRREDAEKLIDYVENQIEKIKEKVVHEIRRKLTGMESSEKDVEAHIKDVVDLQQDFRNVLQSSEGAMIESFTESSAKIELCSNSHKKIEGLNFDGVSEIAETGSFLLKSNCNLRRPARQRRALFSGTIVLALPAQLKLKSASSLTFTMTIIQQ